MREGHAIRRTRARFVSRYRFERIGVMSYAVYAVPWGERGSGKPLKERCVGTVWRVGTARWKGRDLRDGEYTSNNRESVARALALATEKP